jgi:hypothetical protein
MCRASQNNVDFETEALILFESRLTEKQENYEYLARARLWNEPKTETEAQQQAITLMLEFNQKH